MVYPWICTLMGPRTRGSGDDLFCSKGLGAARVSSRLGAALEELGFAAFEVFSRESSNPYSQTGTAWLREANWRQSISWFSDLTCSEEVRPCRSGRLLSWWTLCWSGLYWVRTGSLSLELELLAGWTHMLLRPTFYVHSRGEKKGKQKTKRNYYSIDKAIARGCGNQRVQGKSNLY